MYICVYIYIYKLSKCDVHPRTRHEGPEGEQRYSATLSLSSALDVVGGERHAPAVLPRERPGAHYKGGWFVLGPVWTGAEKLSSTGIRSLDRLARGESLYRLRYPGPYIYIYIYMCVYIYIYIYICYLEQIILQVFNVYSHILII
jgi:hypothetical protein